MTRYVDTNVLLRAIVNDVPELAQRAIELIKQSKRGELVILNEVLIEVFFILEANSQYRYSRAQAVAGFEKILVLPQFKINDTAKAAFALFKKNKKLDFVDCMLMVAAEYQNENLITFDKDLVKALNKAAG